MLMMNGHASYQIQAHLMNIMKKQMMKLMIHVMNILMIAVMKQNYLREHLQNLPQFIFQQNQK